MRTSIPIAFVILVLALYSMKNQGGLIPSSPHAKVSVRRVVPPTRRLSSAQKKRRAMIKKWRDERKKKVKLDRAALLKKVRAILAKKHKQKGLTPAQRAALRKMGLNHGTLGRATSLPVDHTKIKTVASVRRAPAKAVPGVKGSIVELQTTAGNIRLKLFLQKAPITTANFLQYVRSGFYNGTIFHRVIPNFMIQGGGLTAQMVKKPTRAPIKNEADNGLKNERGTVAMARTSYPHSATAQFFINTKDNPFLNFRSKTARGWGYCVFGKVIKGMDVVMKISRVKTGIVRGRANVPLTPIVIKKAVIIQ